MMINKIFLGRSRAIRTVSMYIMQDVGSERDGRTRLENEYEYGFSQND